MRLLLFLTFIGICLAEQSIDDGTESDGDTSRKILGSSVVTSVSVVMETGNGTKAVYTDAVGKPQTKPHSASDLASPIDLLNPDRYEFYTFDDNGDLVKRLMSLEEIKSIIATGDSDAFDFDTFSSNGILPEKRVTDIISNVQNVLKEEMEIHKPPTDAKPLFDTPDVSDSWSMILPAIFGNSGEQINPERPMVHVTPDTIMVEPVTSPGTTSKKPSTTSIPKTSTYSSSPKPSISTISTPKTSSTSSKSSSSSASTRRATTTRVPPISSTSSARPTIDSSKIPLYKVTRVPSKPSFNLDYDLPLFKSTPDEPTVSDIKVSSTGAPMTHEDIKIKSPSTESTTMKLVSKPVQSSEMVVKTSTERIKNISESITKQSTTTDTLRTTVKDKHEHGATQTTTTTTTPSSNIKQHISENSTQVNMVDISRTTAPVTPKIQMTTSSSKVSTGSTNGSFIGTTANQVTNKHDSSTTENIRITIMPNTESIIPQTSANDEQASLPTTLTSQETTPQDDQFISSTMLDSVTNENDKVTIPYDQHLSATELLDQLLQSTNIYEINSELIPIQKNTLEKISANTDIPKDETTTIENTFTTTTSDYSTTTDFTLLQSIEQILSQAINNVNVSVDVTDTKKLQEMLEKSSETNMSQVIKDSATFASSLAAGAKIEEYITLPIEQTTQFSETLLTNSDEATSTEKSNISLANRKSDDNENVSGFEASTIENSFTESDPEISEILNITIVSYESKNNTKENEELNSTPPTTTGSGDSMDKTTENFDWKTTTDVRSTEDDSEQSLTITVPISETTTLDITTTENLMTTPPNLPELTKPTFKNHSAIVEATTKSATTKNVMKNTKPLIRPSIIITINENGSVVTERTTFFKSTTPSNQLNKKITTVSKPQTEVSNQNTSTKHPPMNSTSNKQTFEKKTSKKPSTSTQTPNKTTASSKPFTQTFNEGSSSNNSLKVSAVMQEENNWTLVSTVAPHNGTTSNQKNQTSSPVIPYPEIIDPPQPVDLVPKPIAGFGLEESTASLDTDIYQFAQLCNELAFGFWKTVTADLNVARSVFVSPFAATSMLAMVFLGARGATSGEMNEILKLDDMVTFNPHLTFKNVTESIMNEKDSDVSISIMVRELFSDKTKGKLLDFYKNRVRAFYEGFVEEVNFKEISDVIRRRSNLLVKKYSNGRIPEFLRDSSIIARPPLAGISTNIFQTDCSQTSMEGKDGELHFVVSPSIRQRRLIPIPAVVYKTGFLAGYETSLDATAVALGTKDQIVSTILVIPGQQGLPSQADSLVRLEKRLVESSFKKGAWSRLLRSLIPRSGFEVQIPRFAHRSIINATASLKQMGLHELFNAESADLRGLNGIANELYLSEVLQINSFATCGEKTLDSHHLEVYPTSAARKRSARRFIQTAGDTIFDQEPRDYQRSFTDPLNNPAIFTLPFPLRPRQARLPDAVPRLRFDRPFLYFVRHNPTGLILHMGRFNPRLLP